MKYFTPELYVRGNSRDASIVRGIEHDWERAIQRYRRRWNRIKSAFPRGVRRFEEAGICLHDAELLHMAQEGTRFVMVLEMERPARNLVILTFALTGEPEINTIALPAHLRSQRSIWLYEEFDLDRNKRCCFEVVLTNGWTVKLRFRDFQFVLARVVSPGPNGRVGQRNDSRVSRSA
jgi:hypothetical protein